MWMERIPTLADSSKHSVPDWGDSPYGVYRLIFLPSAPQQHQSSLQLNQRVQTSFIGPWFVVLDFSTLATVEMSVKEHRFWETRLRSQQPPSSSSSAALCYLNGFVWKISCLNAHGQIDPVETDKLTSPCKKNGAQRWVSSTVPQTSCCSFGLKCICIFKDGPYLENGVKLWVFWNR